MHPQPISGTCSPPVCIKFSLLARFSLEPITNWLKKPEKEDFSCLSCTKIGESEVWICFDPWIIFLSCKISICLEPGTAPKSGKVYFSQTSEIVFVEYRDLGSSSLRDGCVPIFGQPGIHAHHLHQSAIEIARLLYNLQKKGVLCLACNFLAVQDSSITDIVCPLACLCQLTIRHNSDTIVTLHWHYRDTTVKLQWHYSDTTVTLQWHYSDTTVTAI